MTVRQKRHADRAEGPPSAILGCVLAIAAAFAGSAFAASPGGAEIVMLVGKGEKREAAQAGFSGAGVNQALPPGTVVRTGPNSQMALLMPDRTQVRLNQNSQIEIGAAQEPGSNAIISVLRMITGRVWSQARPPTFAGASGARVRMTTPTATIGIRGTDWEVEVLPDGSTQVVVLSGNVDVSNEHGALNVGSGEAAIAQPGKAPTKLVLVNPASRVQWVSAWKPQPRRWAAGDAQRLGPVIASIEAGDYEQARATLAPAAANDAGSALLLADLLLQRGDMAQAEQVLAAHSRNGAGDARATALLAQAMARQDKTEQAIALVDAALQRAPADVNLLLARGDLAVLQGDAPGARHAYAAALKAAPDSADAWYGLGLVASEREQVRVAREALGEALKRAPNDPRASAELAATETFAGNNAEGQKLLQDVLARDPANYQALTALGVARLKNGQDQEALDDFLKAGVIEPRYARAHVYSGVAFYRLGETKRALQSFDKASAIDPRDPVPYVYKGMIEADQLDPGASIASARAAQERMPYLKSLNQVATNQRGSANVGSSLAGFGLEEWASYYATQAYSPYWGGSHLFLADRYTGKFNKNSELFKGYMTEPTAFGASNRQSSLVQTPGHYGRVDIVAERDNWNQLAAIGTLNGLTQGPTPIAYFASADLATAEARQDDSSADGRNFTFGLGAKPNYQVGLFGFATSTDIRGKLRSTALPNDSLRQREHRLDLGASYKLEPDNQFWLKAGTGKQENSMSGGLNAPAIATSLNSLFNTTVFAPNGTLDAFRSEIDQSDLQLRHSFTRGNVQWSWGVEHSRQDNDGDLATTFAPVRLDNVERLAIRSTDAYLSGRVQLAGGHEAQGDLFVQRSRIDRADGSSLTVLGTPPTTLPLSANNGRSSETEVNPRLGFQWQLAPLQSVRLVYQDWRRSASAGTLAPIDTLGIPVNDRLVVASGEYQRLRLQYDGEMGSAAFVRAFVDHERVDNGIAGVRTAISDFEVTQLESLRTRPEIFAARSDLEQTPQFVEGKVSTLGLAYNRLLTKTHAIALRYMLRDAPQTGTGSGLDIPYIPRHFVQLDSQWSIPGRWLLGANATYRSSRYRDDMNLDPIRAGFAFGFTAYWESPDKRHSVHLILDNLLPRKAAGDRSDAHFMARYAYRF